MDYLKFIESIGAEVPPEGLSLALMALWWDGKGNWHKAHETAQNDVSAEGSWVHAYLHRKEGDEWNAGYWYRRANKPPAKISLTKEWETLIKHLLN
jgi:hypothetical protein